MVAATVRGVVFMFGVAAFPTYATLFVIGAMGAFVHVVHE